MIGNVLSREEMAQPADGRGRWDPALLVESYADRVYRFLLALTKDREVARDLTQETFLKLHQAGQAGRGDLPSATYVLTVARNTALSWFRRRKLEAKHLSVVPSDDLEPLAVPAADDHPDHELARSELRVALREALATLPEELRSVFLLSEVEGLSYAEIAKVVDCPPGTVASRKHHAILKLRQEMRRQGHAM